MAKGNVSAEEALSLGLCSQCRDKPLAEGRKLFCEFCLADRRAKAKARASRKPG